MIVHTFIIGIIFQKTNLKLFFNISTIRIINTTSGAVVNETIINKVTNY